MSTEKADANMIQSDKPLTADRLKSWSKEYKSSLTTLLKSDHANLAYLNDVTAIATRLHTDSIDIKAIDSVITEVILPTVTHHINQSPSNNPAVRKRID